MYAGFNQQIWSTNRKMLQPIETSTNSQNKNPWHADFKAKEEEIEEG